MKQLVKDGDLIPESVQIPIDPKVLEEQKRAIFHKALLALHGDIEVMKKDESNPFFKSKYVPLPKMLRILKPICQKHGFILSQPTDIANAQQGIVNVVFSSIVHAETGISEIAKLAISNDLLKEMKKLKINNTEESYQSQGTIQGLGAAITYLRRYTLSSLLGLEEADDDGNAVSGRTAGVKGKDKF